MLVKSNGGFQLTRVALTRLRAKQCALVLLTLGVALSSFCFEIDLQEAAAVYAAYVNAHLIKDPFTGHYYSSLIISGQTTGLDYAGATKQEIDKLGAIVDPQTRTDFLARNARYFGGFSLKSLRNGIWGWRVLNPRIKFAIGHTLISDAFMEQIFGNGGGWVEFNRRYPNCRGIISLSNVGFNRNKTQALLYIGYQWDWLAGEGRIVLFRKEKTGWVEEANSVIWVS